MSADLNADDLRALADALDRLTALQAETGVQVGSYGTASLTVQDEPLRLVWQQADTASGGRYAVEINSGS